MADTVHEGRGILNTERKTKRERKRDSIWKERNRERKRE